MPKATPAIRQSNAAKAALATVVAMQPHTIDDQLDEDIESEDEHQDEPQEPTLPAAAAKKAVHRMKWDKASGEDFFDYLNTIPQEERTQGRLRFWATNQDGSIGGMVHQIVGGWVDLDESWMRQQPEIGIGKFKVELRNPGKTGRANDWTIVQIGSDDEISKQRRTRDGRNKEAGSEDDNKAVDVVASAAEKGMGFLGKSYEKALEVRQSNSDPVALAKALSEMKGSQPDMAAMLTAMGTVLAAVIPKKDDSDDKVLFTMLDNQRQDAERRAAAAEKRAEEQRKADKEESDRRERQAREEAEARSKDREAFWAMMKTQSDATNAIMLKQAEAKADAFTQMSSGITAMISLQEKLSGLGGGGKEGWTGVVESLIDRAPDAISGIATMMAARNGATPQQVQALQQKQPQPQPQPAQPTVEDEFQELIFRVGKYMSRDTGLWQAEYLAGEPGDEDNDPIPGMLEVEYPAIFQGLFVGQPKETILVSINETPIGKAILENPYGGPFLHKVIDSIKAQMVPPVEKEPEVREAEPVRKNGKAKASA